VGIESAGTLAVDTRRVPVAFMNACDYAMAGFGDATLTGSNTETAAFHADSDALEALDTGDTGDGGAAAGTAVCGCPTLALDGVDVADCAQAARALVFPFFALGE
jgi:hypothetical protein